MANLSDYYRQPGMNEVGQYQMSGIPWCSSSILLENGEFKQVKFYNITRFITVRNNTAEETTTELRVGLNEEGVQGAIGGYPDNYFLLTSGYELTLPWRVSEVWLYSGAANGLTASVVAGLTGIQTSSLPGFTNWRGNEGVGGNQG